jgi:hypothetical protein
LFLEFLAIKHVYWYIIRILTPKGQTGPTGAKLVLGSVVWTHTIFRILEFFSKCISNKLRVSANFMILSAMDQKLWMFEVLRKSLGRAGMCWSHPARVDHMCKKWRAGGKKNSKKGKRVRQAKRRPAAGGRPAVACRPWVDT